MSSSRCGPVVDVLDAGLREPELGLRERALQAACSRGEPLGVDEQAEALVEGECVVVGACAAAPCQAAAMASSRRALELLEGRFVEHAVVPPSVVVVAARGRSRARRATSPRRRSSAGGQPVEAVLQDRLDVAVGARAGGERARARGLEPLVAVALGQPQDAQAGAVALLGVRPLGEDRLDQRAGVRADALRPSASGATASTRGAPGGPWACARARSCGGRARRCARARRRAAPRRKISTVVRGDAHLEPLVPSSVTAPSSSGGRPRRGSRCCPHALPLCVLEAASRAAAAAPGGRAARRARGGSRRSAASCGR